MVGDAEWKTDNTNNQNAPVRCPSDISTLSANQDICRCVSIVCIIISEIINCSDCI